MPSSIKILRLAVDSGPGLIDTSVLVDLAKIPQSALPAEIAVAAISLAELAAGPHATLDVVERARRQEQLQRLKQLSCRLRSMQSRHVRMEEFTRPSSRPDENLVAVLSICSVKPPPTNVTKMTVNVTKMIRSRCGNGEALGRTSGFASAAASETAPRKRSA